MDKILIVEDELIVARDIRKTLERNGYKVAGVARTADKALQLIREERPFLVLVDIFLKGDLTGIDLAATLNTEGIPFIYVSANSNRPVLEAAKTTNPYGFIVKPFREKDLLVTIDIARYRYEQDQRMRQTAPGPMADGPKKYSEERSRNPVAAGRNKTDALTGIIGKSAGMLKVFTLIQQVGPFDTSVLILGESGTGKEGVATAVVRESARSSKAFIKVNCAAIPAGLLESELFGHEKGSFTGAYESKAGKFEMAAGGTILLDEIGEIPVDMQAKLLRVLQEKEIQRLGSHTTIKADVRIIAATSRNLEQEVAAGRFRLDLYYRLNVFPISLPPLRDRKEDIPLLIDHFIRFYAARTGKHISGPDQGAIQELLDYKWPGNVRELQHLVERTVLLAGQDGILSFAPGSDQKGVAPPTASEEEILTDDEAEKNKIITILELCQFRVTGKGGAAELLNITPAVLYGKIKKFGIKKIFY